MISPPSDRRRENASSWRASSPHPANDAGGAWLGGEVLGSGTGGTRALGDRPRRPRSSRSARRPIPQGPMRTGARSSRTTRPSAAYMNVGALQRRRSPTDNGTPPSARRPPTIPFWRYIVEFGPKTRAGCTGVADEYRPARFEGLDDSRQAQTGRPPPFRRPAPPRPRPLRNEAPLRRRRSHARSPGERAGGGSGTPAPRPCR